MASPDLWIATECGAATAARDIGRENPYVRDHYGNQIS